MSRTLARLACAVLAGALLHAACGGPGLPERLAEARRLRGLGRPADAAALLEGLEKRHPEDATLRLERALALHDAGRDEDALADAEAAIAAAPDLVEARILHGTLLGALGRDDEGLRELRQVAATHPDRAGVHRAMAVIHARAGRNGPAVNQFEKELARNPDDVETLTDLGLFYLQTSQFEQAIDRLQRASSLPDAPSRAHRWYAEVLFKQRQWEAGLAEQRKAIALAPDDVNLLISHARALQGYGHATEGTALLEQAIARGLKAPLLHVERARQAREALDYDGAVAWLQQAIAIEPTLAEAHMDLGKVYLYQGRTAEARASFEEAARLAPTDPYALFYLANLLADEGHHDRAAPLLERSLELDPSNPKAHYALAQAYQRLGRESEARAEFAKHGEILSRLRNSQPMSGTASGVE